MTPPQSLRLQLLLAPLKQLAAIMGGVVISALLFDSPVRYALIGGLFIGSISNFLLLKKKYEVVYFYEISNHHIRLFATSPFFRTKMYELPLHGIKYVKYTAKSNPNGFDQFWINYPDWVFEFRSSSNTLKWDLDRATSKSGEFSGKEA